MKLIITIGFPVLQFLIGFIFIRIAVPRLEGSPKKMQRLLFPFLAVPLLVLTYLKHSAIYEDLFLEYVVTGCATIAVQSWLNYTVTK